MWIRLRFLPRTLKQSIFEKETLVCISGASFIKLWVQEKSFQTPEGKCNNKGNMEGLQGRCFSHAVAPTPPFPLPPAVTSLGMETSIFYAALSGMYYPHFRRVYVPNHAQASTEWISPEVSVSAKERANCEARVQNHPDMQKGYYI